MSETDRTMPLSRASLARIEGRNWLIEGPPRDEIPAEGVEAVVAKRIIDAEIVLDGIPERNLATFVTTWMEPEAQQVIAENLHRNFIDHAEYPQTAEIEQRCIRMLAKLYHAPGETTGARTQGSSEAIMLGALSLKWKWRERREAEQYGPCSPWRLVQFILSLVLYDRRAMVDLIELTLNHGLFKVRAVASLSELEPFLADWHPHLALVDMEHDDSAALLR